MRQPSPGGRRVGERARHHTGQCDWHKGTCGRRGGGQRPVGSGTDRTWGSGAGQPGGHPDRPGVARAGPTWPLSLCCPACPGWFPPGPGQMRPGPARGRGDGGWQGTSGPGEASVTQPTAAFLWSLSPGAWCGRKGALQGGQRDLLPMPPSWPSPSGSADCGDGGSQPVTQGFFPSKGTRAQVAVARPWGQGDHGPLLHQLAGGQDSAGLCPWHRRGCGGKIQVVSLCCGLPRGGGRWATLRAQPRA